MDFTTWPCTFLIIAIYLLCLLLILGFPYILRKVIDGQKNIDKNSLAILSEIKTQDNGLDICNTFKDLEENNIDMSCKIE